jgi:ketosteroid isomerase-like protein
MMNKELESIVTRLFEDFDRLDFDAVAGLVTDDVQGVDELSRRWMRGGDAMRNYFDQMRYMLSDLKSSMSDVHTVTWGDAGILTCWLDQTYSYEGRTETVSAPTTFVFRREGDAWKVALVHSIPLSD